jgi:hypothetical protein
MFEDTPTLIERRERDLNNNELVPYTSISSKHYDIGLTPHGFFLLAKVAGIQGSCVEFPLTSGATAKITFHVKQNVISFRNSENRQKDESIDQLLSSLQTTRNEFMNNAYAFVDGEATYLNRIKGDLEHRAMGSIAKALMEIDGVLGVIHRGPKTVAVRDPGKKKPSLTPLQRALFREGNIVFEDLVGEFKYDRYANGDQIIPEETNPLLQGNPDPVVAQTGTIGHFVSTRMGDEEEGENKVEEEEEEDDDQHYAVTIGHVLQDGTTQAILANDNDQQVVSIPFPFQRLNSKPQFLRYAEMPEQLSEVGCLLVPPGTPVACSITSIDCGGLYELVGEKRKSYYPKDLDKRYHRMLDPEHISEISSTKLLVQKMGNKTGLTEGYLTGACPTIPKARVSQLNKRKPAYYGEISWLDEQHPFADSGDSGSLVYLQLDEKTVPIGIHIGSVGTRSYCLLLTWAIEAMETEFDSALFFCSSDCPGP